LERILERIFFGIFIFDTASLAIILKLLNIGEISCLEGVHS
jgi:hypothetical protein